MKVSIVMAYHNRKKQLLNTLQTIRNSKHYVEVIIIDDASDENQRIEFLHTMPGINIHLERINKNEKTWHNPCIPFNMGFKKATGDIIIIQNPECMHVGDVIDYAVNNVVDNKYVAFACYSADKKKSELINDISLDGKYVDKVNDILTPFVNALPSNDCQNGWYCHPEYNPSAFHFTAAITMKDLEKLGGFNEMYAGGIGYDDFDLIARIRGKGMIVDIVDNPYVVHQAHTPTDYTNNQHLLARNRNLYSTGHL